MSKHSTGIADRFLNTVTEILPKMENRTLEERYFNAVYTRNLKELDRCLEKGVNPNARHREYGVSPLHLLAERDDHVLGYRLLQLKNIDVEMRSFHGETALHLACVYNCRKFVHMLLLRGANPNMLNKMSKTPLHYAVERDNHGNVVKLCKFGADVNVIDVFENTPLSISMLSTKNLAVAKSLFQYGANLSIEHKRPLHIFFETILNCHSINGIEFVNLLLDKAIDIIHMREDFTCRTCLHFVAITGYLELAVFLVEKGANLKVVDHLGRTPAVAALEHENTVLADYFNKGYRPPNLLLVMPLLHLWTHKLKERIKAKKVQIELKEAMGSKVAK